MFRSLVIVFIVFIFIKTHAQTNTLTGIVTDTLSSSLPYTNVLAKPLSQDVDMAFAITDEQGRYKLVLESNQPYVISVSYLGFKSVSFEVKLNKNITKNIQLQQSNNQLDEVIVIQQTPVLVKEDTIIYDTKVFVTGTERKLKQVLKKLPGVEVDKEGIVMVNGKKVTKLLVDGKTFFGGGTKLGVENIPADAVDGVEVLDNYNQVAFLKGLSDSEQMAMNIKLKKDKKQFTFGDIGAGVGTDKHYLIHPNIFYYSPKTNVNFIGDINDVGIKSFTLKDYMNFEGGIGKMLTNPSSYFKLSNNEFANFLGNKDFKAEQNKFAAVNVTQTINDKLDVSTYAIYSNTKTETRNETANQYITEDTQIDEIKLADGETNNTFIMAKVSLDYVPNINEDISYSGFFKSSNNKMNNSIKTTSSSITNNLNTLAKTNAVTVKQNIEWHKKLSRRHTTSLRADYHYNKNNPFSNWLTNQPILQNLLPLTNDDIYNINQIKDLKMHNIDVLFKHYWVINNNNHIYTTIGNNFLKEDYKTNDFQELSNGDINNFDGAGFRNDLNFQWNDLYFGVQHKFKAGITTFKYGISAHYYNWNVSQSTIVNKNKVTWLPDLLTKIDFSKSEHLNFRYNLKSSFVDAPKFSNRFQLLSYNSVTRGNENLENELYHSARLWYTKFSLYRGLIMSGSIGFNKKVKSIRNEVVLDGIDHFTSPILTDNPETSWTFSGNIRKSLGKVTAKFNGNVRFSDYIRTINSQESKNETVSQNYKLELSTNFKKWPNVDIGYKKSFSEIRSSNSTSNYTNESPFVNSEYDFLNGFIFSADYSKTTYVNYFGQKNHFEIVNASLFYQKEDSAWGFKVSGTNILGVDFKYQNSFSDYIITDSRTYILPKIWLFTITYKL